MRHDYFRSRRPTRRELQVLASTLVVGRKGAAAELGISERTVTHALTSLYGRLGAENRTTAALALGWLAIPPGLTDGAAVEYSAMRPAPSPLAEMLAEAVVRYVDGLRAAAS